MKLCFCVIVQRPVCNFVASKNRTSHSCIRREEFFLPQRMACKMDISDKTEQKPTGAGRTLAALLADFLLQHADALRIHGLGEKGPIRTGVL